MHHEVARLLLCGDVMLGRGVDQILSHPGDPTLQERYVEDARTYVRLAEQVNGPIPKPVDVAWPWGDVLTTLHEAAPDVRVINLETSITRHGAFAAGKRVHYRMNPDNIGSLAVARPDVCTLANNHVLDFGHRGLEETLDVLSDAGLRATGAGRNLDQARRPAVVPLEGGGRVQVFSFGTVSSGIPPGWAATTDRPGVELLPEPLPAGTPEIVDRIRDGKQPGDLVVASVHWGSNWGYEIDRDQARLAHALIDGGVDVVHGHSSHHPRPIEIYRDRLILYGCGDLINDYEGITGHEPYRDDLRLLYLVDLDASTGAVAGATMIPMQARRMRLEPASEVDAEWLASVLDRTSRGRGVRVVLGVGNELMIRRA
jgi:poly-gamma-glutamate capsule biosynthesis protein CapA/YwtB (metallophosphatase superfamily)